MPAPGVDLADDAAIARLLAEDAKASSSRYASQGLSALLPPRQAGTAPKPNTRFLKALVRDADSHNAALRRKEDRERVERLRNGGARTAERPNGHSRREKTRGEDESGRERKRRRLSDDIRIAEEDERRSWKSVSRSNIKSASKRRKRSRSRSASENEESSGRRKHHHHNRRRRSKERQDSDSDTGPAGSHSKHRTRRSYSPNRDGDEGQRSRKEVDLSRERQRRRRASSSDPLEDLVGPFPSKEQSTPVRVRGRGAHKIASGSNIDAHFSSNYDPSLDVNPEDEQVGEREDWDMALEALRDRQAWKKKHEDRMRAAGFGEDEIEKWKESGREKGARDVQWRKKGQVREWDVGKDDRQSSDEDQNGRLTP